MAAAFAGMSAGVSSSESPYYALPLLENVGHGVGRRPAPARWAALVSLAVLATFAAAALLHSGRRESRDLGADLEPALRAQFETLLASPQLATSLLAPLVPPVVTRLAKPPPGRFDDLVPVVFLHGEGDASSNPGMQSLCKSASDTYPGLYVVCASVSNGLASITTPLAEQVEEFSKFVKADARLSDGFHAVGLSQGGLVLRGYVETRNEPHVKRFISLCAPHGGVGTCPSTPAYKMVCPLWKLAPYTARLAFADYWKDAGDKSGYLDRSRWLAEINNERDEKKDAYREQMLRLERYVLIEATNDTTFAPHASESHGFYAWGGSGAVVPLRNSEGYKMDVLGLRTLDEAHKLVTLTYQGDHLSFAPDWWAETVLPHLGP